MIVYKVFAKKNGRRYSFRVFDPKYRKRYEKNRINKVKIGKIFVFKSFDDAKYHVLGDRNYEIWECETENAEPISRVSTSPSSFEGFWKNENVYLYGASAGAHVCDSLKLIKKIIP